MRRMPKERMVADLPGRGDPRGFTLFELLVVMVILGILVAFGIPMFAGVRHASELASAEQALIGFLNRARWMAITSGRPNTTVRLASCDAGGVCTSVEVVDAPGGSVLAAAHVSDYGATLTGANVPYSLDNRGFLRTPASVPSLTVRSVKLGQAKTVSVTQLGKVQTS